MFKNKIKIHANIKMEINTFDLVCSKIEDFKSHKKVDLIISSPPYGIGKSYESFKTLNDYINWIELLIPILKTHLNQSGAICWQVGTHVGGEGEYVPLDVVYIPIFQKNGFILKNRIVWKFGSGLHSNNRLSGRYETLLWFVLDNNYTFNLDPIRVNSKEPGKKSYKGPNKGKLSGNPLGKNPSDVWTIMMEEWEQGEWNFPNVKSNHPEKESSHPCQFPIELAERCVLAFSNEGDAILDPFSGTGSTGCAAVFHKRFYIGIDTNPDFVEIAKSRISKMLTGNLKRREIGTPIQKASQKTKTRKIPEEWKEIREEQMEKPRIYKQYKKEDDN
jgi:adenine-specific DNA-methyltransferase